MFSNCGLSHKGSDFVSHRGHGSLRGRHRVAGRPMMASGTGCLQMSAARSMLDNAWRSEPSRSPGPVIECSEIFAMATCPWGVGLGRRRAFRTSSIRPGTSRLQLRVYLPMLRFPGLRELLLQPGQALQEPVDCGRVPSPAVSRGNTSPVELAR